MQLIRYCQAKTVKALKAEIAAPASRDHGTGSSFHGLCCGILGDTHPINLGSLIPDYARRARRIDINACYRNADDIAAYIDTQMGTGSKRVAWIIECDDADVVGLAGRYTGGMVSRYDVDGVLLRPGAKVKVRAARSQAERIAWLQKLEQIKSQGMGMGV